jgi:hypothetical protein
VIGQYGRTYDEFWTGSTGRAMAAYPSLVRETAHFLVSAPNSVKFGLYHKPIAIMAIEFGRSVDEIRDALGVLAKLDFAHFDDTTSFVWVPRMAFYQYRPLPLRRADYNVKAARKWYSSLPRNPFLGDFFDRYDGSFWLSNPEVWPGTEVVRRGWQVAHVPIALPLEQPPAPTLVLTPPVHVERRQNVDQRQLEADFETWWNDYPKKVGKLAARAEWMKAAPTRTTSLDEMLDVLSQQRASHDWLKEGGKYIVDPERYIKKGRWLDTVRPGRAPLARHNEGTLNALMDLSEEDGPSGHERPAAISQRIGAGGDRHKDRAR